MDEKVLLAIAGEPADRNNFGAYITRNIQFYKFKNNRSLLIREVAEFIRSKLAEHKR